MRPYLFMFSLGLAVVLGLGWQLRRIERALETQTTLLTMQANIMSIQSTTMRTLTQRALSMETPPACTPVFAAERP